MHIHLPKPLHGWRQFVGEVGIIVIGVLIALGAEQMVESLRWQQKVRSTDEFDPPRSGAYRGRRIRARRRQALSR